MLRIYRTRTHFSQNFSLFYRFRPTHFANGLCSYSVRNSKNSTKRVVLQNAGRHQEQALEKWQKASCICVNLDSSACQLYVLYLISTYPSSSHRSYIFIWLVLLLLSHKFKQMNFYTIIKYNF